MFPNFTLYLGYHESGWVGPSKKEFSKGVGVFIPNHDSWMEGVQTTPGFQSSSISAYYSFGSVKSRLASWDSAAYFQAPLGGTAWVLVAK